MDRTEIELLTRRAADLPTLRALQRALQQEGESAGFKVALATRGAGSPSESAPRIRVVVESDAEPPAIKAERLVVIEDELIPTTSFSDDERLSETLVTADLVLVPGPARARFLASRVSGDVVACGLARLDEICRDPEGGRSIARRELGVLEHTNVVLYAPTADPVRSAITVLGDEVAKLAAAGWVVLVLAQNWPAAWVERHRALVARIPGLALLEGVSETTALAAADAVVSDGGSLIYEAIALGKGAIWVESSSSTLTPAASRREHRYADLGPRACSAAELELALRSELSGTPSEARFAAARSACRDELLVAEGGAARRMAEELQSRFCPTPSPASGQSATSEGDILENVEARVAFGDISGARAELQAHVARHASSRSYRVLASIARREGELEAARHAVQSAEPLAREELGRVLCERASLEVDANATDAARVSFEEARQLAPDLADPWVGIGSLALHSGDALAAERAFRDALAREKSARVWCGLGLALAAQGRGREALAPFESALDLEADRLAAVYGLVQAGFQCGELAIAERRVAAFVELHSGNLDLVFTLAGLRFQLGDHAGAREMVDRIELFKPDYPGLVELRAKLDA